MHIKQLIAFFIIFCGFTTFFPLSGRKIYCVCKPQKQYARQIKESGIAALFTHIICDQYFRMRTEYLHSDW